MAKFNPYELDARAAKVDAYVRALDAIADAAPREFAALLEAAPESWWKLVSERIGQNVPSKGRGKSREQIVNTYRVRADVLDRADAESCPPPDSDRRSIHPSDYSTEELYP